MPELGEAPTGPELGEEVGAELQPQIWKSSEILTEGFPCRPPRVRLDGGGWIVTVALASGRLAEKKMSFSGVF